MSSQKVHYRTHINPLRLRCGRETLGADLAASDDIAKVTCNACLAFVALTAAKLDRFFAEPTPPRQGSVNGEYGFPVVDAKFLRVFVDGDMPRGVAAWDCDAGWADVLTYDEAGGLVMNGAGDFVLRRVTGKVEVRAV